MRSCLRNFQNSLKHDAMFPGFQPDFRAGFQTGFRRRFAAPAERALTWHLGDGRRSGGGRHPDLLVEIEAVAVLT
jgi:hypothetical protein